MSEPLKNAELVFGLVAPIGTDATKVAENLSSQLAEFGYRTTIVRLSDSIEPMCAMLGVPCKLIDQPEHARILSRIKAANSAYQEFNKVVQPHDVNAMLCKSSCWTRHGSFAPDKRWMFNFRCIKLLTNCGSVNFLTTFSIESHAIDEIEKLLARGID